MYRPHHALLVSALLLTGCGAGGSSASQPEVVQPVATPEVELNSARETCSALFNADGTGLYNTVTGWLIDVEELDESHAIEAERLSTRLAEVEATAGAELATPIGGLREPLDRFAAAWDSRGSWKPGSAYGENAQMVIDGCSDYLPGSTIEALTAQEAAPTGDFEADLAATGFVTEDPQFFREAMVESICVPKKTLPQYQLESSVRMSTNDPRSVEALRLVVAYDCPERSTAFEEALAAVELEKAGG